MLAFEEVFGVALEHVLSDEIDRHVQRLKAAHKSLVSQEFEPSTRLLEASKPICQICQAAACGIHGSYEIDSGDDISDENSSESGSNKHNGDDSDNTEDSEDVNHTFSRYTPLSASYTSLLSRRNEKSQLLQAQEFEPIVKKTTYGEGDPPCSIDCFLFYEPKDGNDAEDACLMPHNPANDILLDEDWIFEWNSDDVGYLKTLLLVMAQELRLACVLAPVLGKKCLHVHKMIPTCSPPPVPPKARKNFQTSKRLNWYDNKRKILRGENWGKNTITHLHDKRRQPRGCEHVGISCQQAGKDCSCVEEKILCDKFCTCADDCKYQKYQEQTITDPSRLHEIYRM